MADHPLYQRLFAGTQSDALLDFHDEVRARLAPQTAMLDLGCGDMGQTTRYRTPARIVWGADFKTHPNLNAPQWFRQLRSDGSIPFADASFDLVTCLWVFEHVRDPATFLAEIRRVLRPGGHLVALTPSTTHYIIGALRLLHFLPHARLQSLVKRLYRRPVHDTFRAWYRLNSARRLTYYGHAAGFDLIQLLRIPNQGYFYNWDPVHRAAILTDWLLDHVDPALGRLYMLATLRARSVAERRSTVA